MEARCRATEEELASSRSLGAALQNQEQAETNEPAPKKHKKKKKQKKEKAEADAMPSEIRVWPRLPEPTPKRCKGDEETHPSPSRVL